jgi:hypothetical protein
MAKLAVFMGDDFPCVQVFNIGKLLDEIRLAKVLGYELPSGYQTEKIFYNLCKDTGREYLIESETNLYTLQSKLRESFELRNLIRIGRFKEC